MQFAGTTTAQSQVISPEVTSSHNQPSVTAEIPQEAEAFDWLVLSAEEALSAASECIDDAANGLKVENPSGGASSEAGKGDAGKGDADKGDAGKGDAGKGDDDDEGKGDAGKGKSDAELPADSN